VDALGGDSDSKVRVTVPPMPPIIGLPRELWGAPASSRERRGSDPPPTLRTEPPPPDSSRTPVPSSGAAITAVRRDAGATASAVIERVPDSTSGPSGAVTNGLPPARLPSARGAPSVPPPSLGSTQEPASVPPLSAARISWPGNSEEYAELAEAARQ